MSQQISLDQAQALVKAIESNDEQQIEALVKDISDIANSQVMEEVEEISRNLHDTLSAFGEDAAILQHTKHDLPDAAEHLTYVISTTEEASNKTLAAAENMLAIMENLSQGVKDESQLKLISDAQAEITEIMMTQSFQDLTGQVLNRIIFLVTALEEQLHDLIHRSGIDLANVPDREETEEDKKRKEMKGMGPLVTDKDQQDSVGSQSDVDDLLGDLGL